MAVVTDRDRGIFPAPKEIRLKCSCPDWAVMCKHVAAVLYGVGARLDANPALLFLLRGVDHEELVSAGIGLPGATGTHKGRARISDDALADVFGIEIAEDRGTVKAETAGDKKKNQSKSLKTSRSESSRKTGRTTKVGDNKTDFLQETFARAKEHAEAASSARPVTGKTVAVTARQVRYVTKRIRTPPWRERRFRGELGKKPRTDRLPQDVHAWPGTKHPV